MCGVQWRHISTLQQVLDAKISAMNCHSFNEKENKSETEVYVVHSSFSINEILYIASLYTVKDRISIHEMIEEMELDDFQAFRQRTLLGDK